MRISFVLPARAEGGGVHSVVQESLELCRLGADVILAVSSKYSSSFRVAYPPQLGVGRLIQEFSSGEDLANIIRESDIVVGTIYTSMRMIKEALEEARIEARVGYYIQDYEPLFTNKESPEWKEAFESYTLIPNAVLFAKTSWLSDTISANHGVRVHKVKPGIDHNVYYPDYKSRRENGKLIISAMIRPSSPRRAPRRTLSALNYIVNKGEPEKVSVRCFGCEYEELARLGLFIEPDIEVHEKLTRESVAELLRSSDVFLDLSDYQAFGRTALEGMACGCVPVITQYGGAKEFLKENINGFFVDVRKEKEIGRILDDIVGIDKEELAAMKREAIGTALNCTVNKAAHSIYEVLGKR